MAQQRATTLGNSDVYATLAEIIKGRVVKRKHRGRVLSGKSPRLARPSIKRSFDAVMFLTHHGTSENIIALVECRLATIAEIQEFLRRTRLSEVNQARIETALDTIERKKALEAEEAAMRSTGGGAPQARNGFLGHSSVPGRPGWFAETP